MTMRLAGEQALCSRRVHKDARSPLGCGGAVSAHRSEGVAAARGRAFEVVVADPGMPDMYGIGFVRPVRQPRPNRAAPIVMRAAEFDKGLKPQAKPAGTAACLAEPFEPKPFIAANMKAPQ